MLIVNHRMDGVRFDASPNHGGLLTEPSLVVIHATASGGTAQGDADHFRSRVARTSAHLVIGRAGEVVQCVPFNQIAWHAGKSIWRDQSDCNGFSLGIELDNWGRLVRSADGRIRSWTGAPVEKAKVAEFTHKHETQPSLWELFPQAQLRSLADVLSALLAAYPSVGEVVGHDDVAPRRKVDPGPAFPLASFAALVTETRPPARLVRHVTPHRLNARGGPGLAFEILGAFDQGQAVEVLYDDPGPWAQVCGRLEDGRRVRAWVADQHLR